MRGSERSELQRVKRQIAFWRKVRRYLREAMPESLWRSGCVDVDKVFWIAEVNN